MYYVKQKNDTDFKVQEFTLQDKLDETSTIDPSFGKYTAFDFDINNNDHFIITVNSEEFTPYMFISSPKGKNIFAFPKKGVKQLNLILLQMKAANGVYTLFAIL